MSWNWEPTAKTTLLQQQRADKVRRVRLRLCARPLALLALVLWLVATRAGEAQTVRAPVAEGPSAVAVDGPPRPVPPAVISRDAEGRTTVRAVRLTTPLQIDGRLDEEIYQLVSAVGDFIQSEPDEGLPETERTEAWIFFDQRNVYVSVRCWDSRPDQIVAQELRRDHGNIFQGDNVTVSFDTFDDKRTGFWFQTNPLGALREALVISAGIVNVDWNTVWDVKSRRFDQGWTTEMAIPFKSLRYNEGREQVWNVQLRRMVPSKTEITHITPVPAAYGTWGPAHFATAATLVDIEPPSRSRNLEIKPYVMSDVITNKEARPPISNDLRNDVGLDVKYGLTRSLIVDVSHNTDFAQVEADEQQVNLTRFSLLFPEKREFFLEGSGIFAFGKPGEDTPVLFFSRQIGLSNGRAVPIQAGGRLTGRAGQYSLGLMNIQTEESALAKAVATNFSVVRVKRDVLRRSSVGVLATNRSPSLGADGSNQAVGIDAALKFFQHIEANAYYARTHTPDLRGDVESYQAQFGYTPDRYGLQLEHLKVGDAFEPGIGFLRHENFRRNYVQGRFSPRPKSMPAIRKFTWEGSLEHIADLEGRLESRAALGTFRVDLRSGDTASVSYLASYEFLKTPFALAPGVAPLVGGYDFREMSGSYRIGARRRVSGSLTFNRGGFYSGDRTQAGYNGLIAVTPRFSIEPRASLNWVDLPEGSFTATLLGARSTFTVTSRMVLSALVQYNSSANVLTTNARLHWEYSSGSDLFVVFSDGRNTLEGPARGLAYRGVAVKFTRLFRF